jgi:hypothetical protein
VILRNIIRDGRKKVPARAGNAVFRIFPHCNDIRIFQQFIVTLIARGQCENRNMVAAQSKMFDGIKDDDISAVG